MWKFPFYEIDKPIDWESLEKNFSWFRDMKNVSQDALWHAEGDVFVHTKMVVETLVGLDEFKVLQPQEKHILFASALMHDIEKRSTTKTEIRDNQERVVSPSHAKKGEFTVREFLYKELETPFKIREHICKLVRHHGLPIWGIEKADPQKIVIEASLFLDTKLLYLLAKADAMGRISDTKEDLLCSIELFKVLCEENGCFGKEKEFTSNYARYWYLSKKDAYVDYEPFDDFEFEVVVLCALPASGKDTYIKNHLELPILSLDDIRREHKISPTNKKGNGRVIQMAKEQAKVFMRSKTSFVFNATNITKELRGKWIMLFNDYHAKVKIVYLEVPYKILLKQNKNRPYPVPAKVIEKLLHKLEIPLFDEGVEVEYKVNL